DSAGDGRWVGVSARVSVLVYDARHVSSSSLPRSVLGLASPRWKGKLELAPAETDFWPIVSSVARARGNAAALAWLKAIKSHPARAAPVPDNEPLLSAATRGPADLGLINHYYYFRLQSEIGKHAMHAKIAYFAPGDPGYVEDISGAAMLQSSTHKSAAAR